MVGAPPKGGREEGMQGRLVCHASSVRPRVKLLCVCVLCAPVGE